MTGDSQFDNNLYRLFFLVLGIVIGVLADHTLYKPGNIAGWNHFYHCMMWYNTEGRCPGDDGIR